ncbi:MAG: acyl-CoA thioesterase [Proteobacteria bacterium]|nr:acyl-CoA thioesterase [Pseudomonadota bacterium]
MPKQEKSLHMTILMTPDMANFSGNVHGGSILKLLDQVAYACAARYCQSYVVTLSLDQVTFNQPIKVGELVSFRAHVNYVGKSSLEVGVKVFSEDLQNKNIRHANSCYVTMVAMNEDGKSITAPPLELKDEFEKKLYEAAVMRKELRKESVQREGYYCRDTGL